MSTIGTIDGVANAIIEKIDENRAKLGNPQFVYEKVEDPAILAENHLLPAIHVVPFAEGVDSVHSVIGSEIGHHEFAITIIGTYDTRGVNEDLRMIREYGYACVDLFKGKNSRVGNGFIHKITVRFGAYAIVDRILQQYFLTLHVKAYDDGTP